MKTDFFKIEHNNIAPEQGKLLVSEPFTPDMVFKRSVILLTEYNKKGAVGFILNKSVKKKLSEISDEFGDFDAPVFLGGPVAGDSIFYIHTLGDKIPNSIKIKDNLFWGGDFDVLSLMISAGKVKKDEIMFFVGYSGWSQGQLDDEISKNFWLVADLDVNTIMTKDKGIWKNVLTQLDDKYQVWANFPENPGHN